LVFELLESLRLMMREILFLLPEAGPKRILFDAAERLFAERGFEVVSVRDVTQLAKTHVAAVNYHFGSREGLMILVMAHYLTPINEARLARLDLLERKWPGKAILPLEEVIDAFVRPLVGQLRKSQLPEPLLYKLLGRIFTRQGDGLPRLIAEPLQQTSERFVRAFERALPLVSTEDLVWRVHFMVGGMIHMLMHRELLLPPGAGSGGAATMDATLSRFVRFAAVGLRGGVASESQEVEGPQAQFNF
jgi:AcrR family transcriptional regulator